MLISESEINWFLNAKETMKYLNLGIIAKDKLTTQAWKEKVKNPVKLGMEHCGH